MCSSSATVIGRITVSIRPRLLPCGASWRGQLLVITNVPQRADQASVETIDENDWKFVTGQQARFGA